MRPNDYTSLQGWMYDMGLNLSELITYAVIYGFSWDGHSCYRGTVEQIGEFSQIKRRQARDILARLEHRGLITRKEVPGKITEYAVVLPVPRSVVVNPGTEVPPAVDCLLPGSGLPITPAVDCLPNNNRNNIEIIDTQSSARAYGDKVRMTEDEHAKLVAKFGTEDTARLCEILDNYLVNNPRKHYASHYRAILQWCVRELNDQKTSEQRLKNAQQPRTSAPNNGMAYNYGEQAMENARRLEELLKN